MSKQPAKIIAYTCNWNAYNSLERAGFYQISYMANIYPIRVTCLGQLHPGLILKPFELGADGVLLLGCPPGECQYGSGSERAQEILQETVRLAHLLGIDEERLHLEWLAPGQEQAFVETVQQFVKGIAETE